MEPEQSLVPLGEQLGCAMHQLASMGQIVLLQNYSATCDPGDNSQDYLSVHQQSLLAVYGDGDFVVWAL